MKWLKNWAGNCLYFMQLLLHYILFGENFIGSFKIPLFSVCLNLNHKKEQNGNQNGRVEKMAVLAKTFNHYYTQVSTFSTVL